jgi:hypothetical protein
MVNTLGAYAMQIFQLIIFNTMENLFNWDYISQKMKNLNSTTSRFNVNYGQDGNIIHCSKDSYKLITTKDLSSVGNALIGEGLDVKSYTHKFGEVIGLNVLLGDKPTVVGEKTYSAIIHVPNNGSAIGKLLLKEVRLICTNGLIRESNVGVSNIKIPHLISYKQSLEIAKNSILAFKSLVAESEEKDSRLNDKKLDKHQAMLMLNDWYYKEELPISAKADMTFEEFRKLLAINPDSIPFNDRYEDLVTSFKLECDYNISLGLGLSYYTVFASCTNYLSRRVEKSKADAPREVIEMRASKKVQSYF